MDGGAAPITPSAEQTHAEGAARTEGGTPRRSIRVISALLASQIAAGEVVERPASVVRELLDNALDAGATRIVVELEHGGIELIRVTDEGRGVPHDELALALTPHATSKISSVDELDKIATLGFRGEALASICSVARVTMRSRTPEQLAPFEIGCDGDAMSPVRPASGPVGTSITVRNLFFNTPARRKFLRTPTTEQGRCVEAFRAPAMAHPGIGFVLRCDGRTVHDLPKDQSPRQRVLDILGRELAPELLEVSIDGLDGVRGLTMWGLVGKPSIARATGAAQFVFINGRPVRDKVVQHALREGFRGLIEPSRFPTAVLMIEMDPAGVDVNVHPAKSEVRFRDSSLVHGAVLRAVRGALQAADLTPSVAGAGGSFGAGGFGTRDAIVPTSPAPRPVPNWATPHAGGVGSPLGAGPVIEPRAGGASAPASPARTIDAGTFARLFREVRPGGNLGLNFNALRRATTPAPATTLDAAPVAPQDPVPGTPVTEPTLLSSASASAPAPSTPVDTADALSTIAPPAEADAPAIDANMSPALQVFDSFLVTQDEQGIVIIDQHALHERVMFEKLLARVSAGPLESQRLLVPTIVGVSPAQLEALERLAPLLEKLGIDAVPAGPASVAVHAFTTLLFERGVEPDTFLGELLERATGADWESSSKADASSTGASSTGALSTEAALHEVLDMMACKAAIKAGDHLSDLELAELLALRDRVERSSNCPHGRPTSIRMSVAELYKRFGRT
jgi:DNA mismatch repair protein MutL